MNYQTYKPHSDLAALIKFYWTLEVPTEMAGRRQRIIPDGCLDMAFILGDDIKRYTSEDSYILQPRAMMIGQITAPFFVEPTGYVNSFAVRFYPYGFANFVATPMTNLANKETPLAALFGEKTATELEQQIITAKNVNARIEIIEAFLFNRINNPASIDDIVKATIDMMLAGNASSSLRAALQHDPSKRRQLERKFRRQIGMSPKQLGKVIRLQTALKMMLESRSEGLATIAYSSDYYDQSHFTKDFKEFTGTTPKEFFADAEMTLSSLLYT